jgi:hypothetical protein
VLVVLAFALPLLALLLVVALLVALASAWRRVRHATPRRRTPPVV